MSSSKKENVQPWQPAEAKTIFETPVVTIGKGPVVCPRTGGKSEFYRLDFPHWVNVIALTPDRNIVLVKQFRYGSGQVETEIPGGVLNVGEAPVDGGLRELLEETGYAGKEARLIGQVNPNPALQANWCYTVYVKDAVKVADPGMDEMEDIEVFLLPESAIPSLLTDGSISHGLVLNALTHYLHRR